MLVCTVSYVSIVSIISIIQVMLSVVSNETIEFMFLGKNMFWARLRLILAPATRRGLK